MNTGAVKIDRPITVTGRKRKHEDTDLWPCLNKICLDYGGKHYVYEYPMSDGGTNAREGKNTEAQKGHARGL